MLEHGSYTYEIKDNIIIFSLLGAFNEQGVIACLTEQRQQIQSFGNEACFLVVDSRGQSGATPEVYQAVDDFYHNLNSDNLSAIAIVHTSPIMTRLHERDIPELNKYRTEIFPDVDSAILWLKGL